MKKLAVVLVFGLIAPALAGVGVAAYTITSTGTAVRSAKIGAGVRHIVQCDAASRIAYGDVTVVATTTSMHLALDEKWEDVISPGGEYISAISDSGTANCYVYPVIVK